MEQKYSLFLLEKHFGGFMSDLTEGCFKYVNTFNTLEEAKTEQEKFELKTIILIGY